MVILAHRCDTCSNDFIAWRTCRTCMERQTRIQTFREAADMLHELNDDTALWVAMAFLRAKASELEQNGGDEK